MIPTAGQGYDSDRDLVSRISRALGTDITGADGKVCRSRLASVIFSDAQKLSALESIVHPAVKEDFVKWRDSFPEGSVPFVVMESAIILEKPLFKDIADRVLLIDAPVQVRMERAVRRDCVAADRIRSRMAAQKLLNDISEGLVRADADYVIVNDSDEAALFRKADSVYASMCGMA